MRNQELQRQLQRLKDLVDRTRTAAGTDLELQAHWGRYLCVLVAGFLENAVAEVYSDFVRRASSPRPARFCSRAVGRIQNPKSSRFVEIAREFDPAWAVALEEYLSEEGRREAIDGIMANRHQIAHGKDSRITVARVHNYLEKCVDVVEFLEEQCRN